MYHASYPIDHPDYRAVCSLRGVSPVSVKRRGQLDEREHFAVPGSRISVNLRRENRLCGISEAGIRVRVAFSNRRLTSPRSIFEDLGEVKRR